jgi:hypothetical protein
MAASVYPSRRGAAVFLARTRRSSATKTQETMKRQGKQCLTLLASSPRRCKSKFQKEAGMLWWILLIILIVVLLAALPTWEYSSGWGYYPSGLLAVLVVVLLLFLLIGVI